MGRVVWIHSLANDQVSTDQSDKPFILKFSKQLDRLCTGSQKFSDFIDATESKAILDDDHQGFQDGWDLIKHKAQWFKPEDGINLITLLVGKIESEQIRFGLFSNRSIEVIAELKECLQTLHELQKNGALFNLGLVE